MDNFVSHGKGINETTDLGINIARGNITGSQPFGGYGKRTTDGAEPDGLLWANGEWFIPIAAGEQIRIISTSPQDGVGGTGIRSIHLHYLDADLNDMDEEITLDGTTEVLTVATNVRFIQCGHLDTFGASKKAEGIITFTNLAADQIYNQIDAGEVRCTSSARMCPAGKRLVVAGFVASSISGTAAAGSLISFATTYFAGHDYTEDTLLIPMATVGLQDNSQSFVLPVPHIVNEGHVMAMLCSTDKAATITGSWFGWLEDVPPAT